MAVTKGGKRSVDREIDPLNSIDWQPAYANNPSIVICPETCSLQLIGDQHYG
jgi:hypothetical protein